MTNLLHRPAFAPAARPDRPVRLALVGAPGTGKKYTALALATAWGGEIGVVDTEGGAAGEYANVFPHLTLPVTSFHPTGLHTVVAAANEARLATLIVSTLSSYWSGPGGMLETVATLGRSSGRDKNAGWDQARPIERDAMAALRGFPGRLIVTCRTKVEYVAERDETTGQLVPRPVGTKPDQSGDFAYDWPLVICMTAGGVAVVDKSHYPDLTGRIVPHPGADLAADILAAVGDPVRFCPADVRDQIDTAEDLDTLRTLRAQLDDTQRAALLLTDDGRPVNLSDLFLQRRKALLPEPSPLAAAVVGAAA